MPECEYCDASFEDDDAYLAHLADEHESELGPIDRRRVSESQEESGGLPLLPLLVGVAVLAAAGAAIYLTVFSGPAAEGIEGQPLDDRGDQSRLGAVEAFPNQGTQHVDRGTQVDYAQMPPLSGPHYSGTVDAGFYSEQQPLGDLVHTLEHGAVVVYYDPAATTPEVNESLREFASVHTGTWRSVVVVPNPVQNPDSPYVLTAWRHRLRMQEYDAQTVHAFLSEYLGRGPENPVR